MWFSAIMSSSKMRLIKHGHIKIIFLFIGWNFAQKHLSGSLPEYEWHFLAGTKYGNNKRQFSCVRS